MARWPIFEQACARIAIGCASLCPSARVLGARGSFHMGQVFSFGYAGNLGNSDYWRNQGKLIMVLQGFIDGPAARARLKVSRQQLYRWRVNGRIPFVWCGNHAIYREVDIERLRLELESRRRLGIPEDGAGSL